MHRNLNSQGFTLTELMLAMVLFSTVLVVSTVGFIGMNRTFSRGTIKRQLSQDIQTVSTDITRTLRLQPVGGSLPEYCNGGVGCSTADLQTLAFGSVCYLWPMATAPDRGGLYKKSGSCNSASDTVQIMGSRYMVRSMEVSSVGVDDSIYRFSGIFSTLLDEAIRFDNTGKVLSCKGTAESPEVASCAVQKFEFSINRQGESI
jgi:prepilin-type N-terminal cleavage/methylation domain-containing protein